MYFAAKDVNFRYFTVGFIHFTVLNSNLCPYVPLAMNG